MKNIFLILTLVFSILQLSAISSDEDTGECIYRQVDISPRSESISRNPVILIDYRESDFQIFEE